LKRAVPARKRSRFITESLRESLSQRKTKQLAEDYQAAAAEIQKTNRELEGVIFDGLD
jgi:metal-responsive CopG/Arc/MetJ family transcriptional regulator